MHFVSSWKRARRERISQAFELQPPLPPVRVRRTSTAFRRASWFLIVLSCLLCLAGGCELGTKIHLGDGPGESVGGEGGAPPWTPIIELSASNVQMVVEVSDAEKDDNPTLTADELEMCLSSKREGGQGGSDIWCSRRTSTDEPFGIPEPLLLANASGFESSPALALDGLTLWFGSRRDQQDLDIYSTARSSRDSTWNEPSVVVELSSESDDIPRPLGMMGTTMPLGSRRSDEVYRTYLATRSTPQGPFSSPAAIAELEFDGLEIVDAFLSQDGLLLLYSRVDPSSENRSDIYFSYREAITDPFGPPQPLTGANTEQDDRDPWLSQDGQRLYFASDRSGNFDIYVATISWQFL